MRADKTLYNVFFSQYLWSLRLIFVVCAEMEVKHFQISM